MDYEIMRVTAKGQLTIPVSIRKKLNIREGDYLQVCVDEKENEIRLKKIEQVRPLSPEDPIWQLIGAGTSGQRDVSVNHDRCLAGGEIKQWKE
ncbi:MAG: AbrB/MazE/SpoVT family DNA-binding domain-containing protein [Firmicutes bacterium]|nr:AbrB/MazE/SpoVT family DNA-binding domain-containing protein [Bacillota bacterium]